MNNLNNCVESCNPASTPNDIKLLLNQLKREIDELSKTTEAKLLLHDGKIAELCKYLKDNLSNSIRDLLDSMVLSGEMNSIISTVIGELFNYQITLSQFGATGESEYLDTEALKSAIKFIGEHKEIALILDKDYTFTGMDLSSVSGITIKGINPKVRIKMNGSIIIPTTHNNFKDICFYATSDITLLELSGRYNNFDNVNLYGGNNNLGIGANISGYANTFTNSGIREFAKNVIISNNHVNFINTYLVGCDDAKEGSNNITINDGDNINFTDCDIEKGYKLIESNGGLSNFFGCYLEGGRNKYHIELNDGVISFNNNYLNNMYIAKYEKCHLTIVNNIIRKINDNVYTLFCMEENIGYLFAEGNKFIDDIGMFTNVNYNKTGSNLACVRYYNGTSWANGVKSDYQYVNQERCKTVDPSLITNVLITPYDVINAGSTRPTGELVKAGTPFFDTFIMKQLTYRSSSIGWVDALGNTPSAKRESAPNSGTWKVGDIVFNSKPSKGSYIGWVCTQDGEPGTWAGFGKVE